MFKSKLLGTFGGEQVMKGEGKSLFDFPGLLQSSSSAPNSRSANKENRINWAEDGEESIDHVNREYGLLGLLDRLGSCKGSNMMLSCGTDLSNMVNFSSTEPLYHTFHDPFSDRDSKFSPAELRVYKRQECKLSIEHFKKYHIDSLFYLFYSMPNDLYQALSAQELYRREWRYHRHLLYWMKANTENTSYTFFEIKTFVQKMYPYPHFQGNELNAGFLSEDEIRVNY